MMKKCRLHKVGICASGDTVLDVARKMLENNERHLYVVDSMGSPLGIISAVDITNRLVAQGKDPKKTPAGDIMNSPVEFVSLNQEWEFALKIMMKYNSLFCPVVSEGKLIGTVSYSEAFSKVKDKITGVA